VTPKKNAGPEAGWLDESDVAAVAAGLG